MGKAVDELQLMTMLNGEYDHSNAILTFHAGTGGTEAQYWAEMLYRMYNKWAQAHGMTVEVLDYQDGDEEVYMGHLRYSTTGKSGISYVQLLRRQILEMILHRTEYLCYRP